MQFFWWSCPSLVERVDWHMQKVKWVIFFLCATFSINYPCHQLSSAANYCSTWGGGWKILSQLMWPNIFRQNSPIITPTSKNPIYLWLQTIHDASIHILQWNLSFSKHIAQDARIIICENAWPYSTLDSKTQVKKGSYHKKISIAQTSSVG